MAMGARKAFEECFANDRSAWERIPFLGCDGLPKTGHEWIRQGHLTATVFIPPNAGQAVELMVKSIETGSHPPERTFTAASSVPAVEALANRFARARGTGR